ncbi:MAG: hypothetical protein U0528_06715 [Anaerolineae bacterium]
MQNCTTVTIAHRLSTIKIAHRICVLEHGKITERRRHAMMALNGLYAAAKPRRSSGREAAAVAIQRGMAVYWRWCVATLRDMTVEAETSGYNVTVNPLKWVRRRKNCERLYVSTKIVRN